MNTPSLALSPRRHLTFYLAWPLYPGPMTCCPQSLHPTQRHPYSHYVTISYKTLSRLTRRAYSQQTSPFPHYFKNQTEVCLILHRAIFWSRLLLRFIHCPFSSWDFCKGTRQRSVISSSPLTSAIIYDRCRSPASLCLYPRLSTSTYP